MRLFEQLEKIKESNDWQSTEFWKHLWNKLSAGEISEDVFAKMAFKRFTPEEQERIKAISKNEVEFKYNIRWAAEVKAERPINAFAGFGKEKGFSVPNPDYKK